MLKRPILTIFFASLTFIITLCVGILSNEHVQVSLFNKALEPLYGTYFEPVIRIDPEAYSLEPGVTLAESTHIGKYGDWSYCDYEIPVEPNYAVELQEAEVSKNIQSGQRFTVDISFKNTGNARLYSENSGCFDMPVLNVGTKKPQDRKSVFASGQYAVSGWQRGNRIVMENPYADPGDEFYMTFESIAPEGNDIYREYYQPVVENVSWIGESFGVDIPVGSPTASMTDNIQFITELSLQASSLEGIERNLEITLDDQMMYARFGDLRVWSMPVSSGAWDTPTPKGNYSILTKQELRIGSKYPHYRMPYFQLWQSSGYGIHALPYLANDGGAFWYEALEHIGIPVSHGCVRTMPEDAVTAYNFTSVGTALWIH